jgi:phosphoribosylglycinamide formyltransferase-1
MPGDTPESLASRVHELEYAHFPEVIENLIEKLPERIRK